MYVCMSTVVLGVAETWVVVISQVLESRFSLTATNLNSTHVYSRTGTSSLEKA